MKQSRVESAGGLERCQKMTSITLMLIIVMTITLITLIIRVIGAPLVATINARFF